MSEGLDFASPADAAAFIAERPLADTPAPKKERNKIRPTTAKHFEVVDDLRLRLAEAHLRAGDFRDKYRLALLGLPIVGLICLLTGLLLGKQYG